MKKELMLTAKARKIAPGKTYKDWIDFGWTDDLLISHDFAKKK